MAEQSKPVNRPMKKEHTAKGHSTNLSAEKALNRLREFGRTLPPVDAVAVVRAGRSHVRSSAD